MKNLTTLFLTSIIFVSTSAEAAKKKKADPNLYKEGNKVLVKRDACLSFGGYIEEDKRYFVCTDGKYDGYITQGPAEEPEGDKEEEL